MSSCRNQATIAPKVTSLTYIVVYILTTFTPLWKTSLLYHIAYVLQWLLCPLFIFSFVENQDPKNSSLHACVCSTFLLLPTQESLKDTLAQCSNQAHGFLQFPFILPDTLQSPRFRPLSPNSKVTPYAHPTRRFNILMTALSGLSPPSVMYHQL